MTQGEYRVGIDFNPSGDDLVGKIKRAAADLIDLIGTIQPTADVGDTSAVQHAAEQMRLRALAMTAIEEGAMWGVKAATKKPPQ